MSHPLAHLIPIGNAFQLPRTLRRGRAAPILEEYYNPDSGRFVGAFVDKDDQADWCRRIARWDREDFRKNTPGTKKLFSDIASTLKSGEGQSFPNFRHALELWDGNGDKPFTRYQQFGSCVDSQRSEGADMMMGWRAARYQEFGEVYKYASTYGPYMWRGYCGDGWNGSGLAAVCLRTGEFFAMQYEDGTNKLDMRDELAAERTCARGYCSRPLQWWGDYAHKHHPYEDGAITEFDGDIAGMRDVLYAGGFLATGGMNTSGSSKPFVVGRVGGHEQAVLGGDDSAECRKFFGDLGFTIPAGDFVCVFSQTWGDGWSGEIADKYWPVGTKADGTVFTQDDLNQVRNAQGDMAARSVVLSLKGTWGWGEKPEGAWLWLASQVLRYFGGDIFAFLPRVKGFPGDVPPPPPPPPVPPPGQTVLGSIYGEEFSPGRYAIRGEIILPNGSKHIAVPDAVPDRFKFVPKPIL